MREFSVEEIYQEVGKIVGKFTILECDRCAKAVLEWLKNNGIPGKVIKLKTKKRKEFFIVSDRWTQDRSITDNGIHYGVEVAGRVFDNLSTEGMSRESWLNDFHCPSEEFIVEELEDL